MNPQMLPARSRAHRRPTLVIVFSSIVAATAIAAQTTRVSVDSAGGESAGGGEHPVISKSGRFVAFDSFAADLVTGDGNGQDDVFVRDRKSGTTTRVSIDSTGVEGNGSSTHPRISANGRFVAFESDATNLVTGDTNTIADVFVHDRKKGKTTRVSIRSNGAEAVGTDGSGDPSISASGRFVAFESEATNLVPGDTNGVRDVFVHDRANGTTTRVSVRSNGAEGTDESRDPSISANGRFVAFESLASNLVPGDVNGVMDVFVHDRTTGKTVRVSVDSAGVPAIGGLSSDPSISATGRFVAFESDATNLVTGDLNTVRDVFLHDIKTGKTSRLSVDSTGVESVGGNSGNPSITANGRIVAFESDATNLVTGDTNLVRDVFVRNRKTQTTSRESVDSAGTQTTMGESDDPAISAKGRFVVFKSDSDNLVTGDTNMGTDIFVRDRK